MAEYRVLIEEANFDNQTNPLATQAAL